MKKRSLFWDNYKGILICLVVFGHFICSYGTNIGNSFVNDLLIFIYIFHMPAFVFCSGFLSRSGHSRGKRPIVELALYYLLFNTLMMLYYYFCEGMPMSLLTPYHSYWYILSLIVWRLCVGHLADIKGIVPFSFAVALLVGFWGEFSNVLALSRTVAFFPFFLLGYRLDVGKLDRLIRGRTPKKMLLGYVLAAAAALLLFVFVRNSSVPLASVSMQHYASGKYMLWRVFIFGAAAAAIAAMLLTVPDVRIPILTRLGKNSLLIFLVHRFVTLAFDKIFPYSSYSGIYLVYAFAASVITLLVLGNDRLNERFTGLFRRAAQAVTEKDSRAGQIVTAVVLAAAVLIAAVPLFEIAVNR